MDAYLRASDAIDFANPAIADLARRLREQAGSADAQAIAAQCFNWVRDHIEHCIDFAREEVPVSASQTLAAGTGFCFAKSHLLAALLRANAIPCGFVYQRLTVDGPAPIYCLHGLNAVYLPEFGWYLCDARGNSKPGIHAQFQPPQPTLAYPVQYPGECLYAGIYAEPWPALLSALSDCRSVSHWRAAPIDLLPPDLTSLR
ncbi:transglutaminase family protein [Chitinibacter sp. GC72]|uniref:transglutaminase-like domain-containing protein n=1 Tax=Chitinibacter sp. GC72 TaxID=1526917 RepID=UPI0018E06109|nr:transglutaminase family protein [Chitinibacter sp. GC72]